MLLLLGVFLDCLPLFFFLKWRQAPYELATTSVHVPMSEATLHIAPRLDAHGGLPSFGGAHTSSLAEASVAPTSASDDQDIQKKLEADGESSDDVSLLNAWAGVLADPLRASKSSLAADRPVIVGCTTSEDFAYAKDNFRIPCVILHQIEPWHFFRANMHVSSASFLLVCSHSF
jgi:hypothetical protein